MRGASSFATKEGDVFVALRSDALIEWSHGEGGQCLTAPNLTQVTEECVEVWSNETSNATSGSNSTEEAVLLRTHCYGQTFVCDSICPSSVVQINATAKNGGLHFDRLESGAGDSVVALSAIHGGSTQSGPAFDMDGVARVDEHALCVEHSALCGSFCSRR